MLKPHNLCKTFPLLDDKAIAVKAADIQANGLTPEIVTHEDKVLDCYSDYLACLKAGVDPRLKQFTGDSPAEFAARQNTADQTYTDSQLTVFAYDFLPPLELEAKERQRLGKEIVPDPDKGQSRDKAAALFGISGKSVSTVKKVEKMMPEIIPLVRSGDLTVYKSNKIAKVLKGRTHEERQQLCDAGVEALLAAIKVHKPAPEVLTGDTVLLEAQADGSVDLFLATGGYTGLADVAAKKLTPGGVVLCPCSLLDVPAALAAMSSLEFWCQFIERRGGHCQAMLAYAKAPAKERPAWFADLLKEEELLRRLVKPVKPEPVYKIGTKQIAEEVCNIADGCSHCCLMCYRQKLCDWRDEPEEGRNLPVFRNPDQADDHWDTTVMFSSNHDTEPALLEESIAAMRTILKQGNHLFWVTKPHMVCVERVCKEFKPTDKFTFMPTIMTLNESLQKFWAPGAPGCEEALACLKHAHAAGFHTSVISEPMLDAENIVELYERIEPFITDEILVGPMNHLTDVRKRNAGLPGLDEALAEIEKWQTDEALWKVYEQLSGRPKVRFKDDFRKTLGLPPN